LILVQYGWNFPCRSSVILESDLNQGADPEEDGEPFDEKMAGLTTVLREQTEKAKKPDQIIWANLEDIGYGG
jgi:hypothetical protein